MRTKDVQVGQTYRCEVPFALPLRRYRPETMGDSWWPLSWLRGTHFPLAVVDVDAAARTGTFVLMLAGCGTVYVAFEHPRFGVALVVGVAVVTLLHLLMRGH